MLPNSYRLELKSRLAIASSGLAAGLISSLAISALILLVERVAQLPMGTFYITLASAIIQPQHFTIFFTILLGFLMHLAAGTVMGLVISLPLGVSQKLLLMPAVKHTAVYGLVAGFLLWLVVFLPVTYGIMIPLLNSHASHETKKLGSLPAGANNPVPASQLLSLIDKVIIGSLAFNMFYGILAAILSRSMVEAHLSKYR